MFSYIEYYSNTPHFVSMFSYIEYYSNTPPIGLFKNPFIIIYVIFRYYESNRNFNLYISKKKIGRKGTAAF